MSHVGRTMNDCRKSVSKGGRKEEGKGIDELLLCCIMFQ